MPTQTTQIVLPRLHPAQQRVRTQAKRFNVLACGRRWGKTTLGMDRLIPPALHAQPVAWFAPTYRMMIPVWRDVRRVLQPVTARANDAEHRLELITGGVLEFWSLDTPDLARGRKYARVIVDEAAMIVRLREAWQAVIRPTLADLQGDAWFLSTPKGLNYFRDLHARAHDDAQNWMSWQMPTAANPFIMSVEIEAARQELPERVFAQEFLAQFLDFEGAVFRKVQAAATASAQEQRQPQHEYVCGVDWGKSNDYTVIAVIDLTTHELCAWDRFNRIDYVVQSARLAALCERFAPRVIIAEANAMGTPIIEQLQRQGLPVQPFTTTNASKAQIVDGLALAFERSELQILNEPILLGELQAFEAERLPSGALRYGAPYGQHDDCVMALALAWSATQNTLTGKLFY